MEIKNDALDRVKEILAKTYGEREIEFPILNDWYAKEVVRTAPKLVLPDNFETCLNLAVMGLAGEAGEVVDLVKKHQHHGVELDHEKLKKEAGDVLWYLQYLCLVLGVHLDDIALQNVYKLRLRYPVGFNTQHSIERKDEHHEPGPQPDHETSESPEAASEPVETSSAPS